MVGSYCFTFISDDNSVYAARDPKGFRPMVQDKESDDTYIVTSESAAITAACKITT